MVTHVQRSEVEFAFEFVNFGGMGENEAYISLDTGRVFYLSEHPDFDEETDEPPEDFPASDRYVAIPDQRDLGLGLDLVFRFVEQHLPKQEAWVRDNFRAPGAYGRFKHMLDRENMLDRWHEFEDEATRRALREWCELHDIELVEERGAVS